MSTKTLSDLTAVVTPAGADILHTRQTLTDKSITLNLLAQYILQTSAYADTKQTINTNTDLSALTVNSQIVIDVAGGDITVGLHNGATIAGIVVLVTVKGATNTAYLKFSGGATANLPLKGGNAIGLVWNGTSWIVLFSNVSEKVFSIASADQTYTMPDTAPDGAELLVMWTGGVGTYALSFTTAYTIGGQTAANIKGEGLKGYLRLRLNRVTSDWEVLNPEGYDEGNINGVAFKKYIYGIATELEGDEQIYVELNSNNPPTIKAKTQFLVKTGGALSQAISETADVTLAWSAGGLPAKTNSTTYYLVCSGAQGQLNATRGKGTYNVSTSTPTYDEVKKGWYIGNNRVLSKFYVDGSGNVINLLVLDPEIIGFVSLDDDATDIILNFPKRVNILIDGWLEKGSGSGGNYAIEVNGDNTASNYWTQYWYATGSGYGGVSNNTNTLFSIETWSALKIDLSVVSSKLHARVINYIFNSTYYRSTTMADLDNVTTFPNLYQVKLVGTTDMFGAGSNLVVREKR